MLPGSQLACCAGALVAALQPLFAFISAGVNNDALLYLAATGVLWGIARVFKRGLTPANGAILGAFLGFGLLAKLTLLAFVPAAALAVAILLWRGLRRHQPGILAGAGWAVGLGGVPIVVYYVLNRFVWHRNTVVGGLGTVTTSTVGRHFNRIEEISHIWQLFLPDLWMRHQFPTYFPLWRTWFIGLVGRFGWLDYEFPLWVDDFALVLLIVVVLLARHRAHPRRRALLSRAAEALVYLLVPVGLAIVIGVQSYTTVVGSGGVFEQARYLLPLLGLYGALVALAVRAGGRRWAPALAVAFVVLAVGHDIYGAGDHDREVLRVSEVTVAIPVRNGGALLAAHAASAGAPDGRARAARVRLRLARRLGRGRARRTGRACSRSRRRSSATAPRATC